MENKEDTVQFKKKIIYIGTSKGTLIPNELLSFLGAQEPRTPIKMIGVNGKKGKFVAFWVDEEEFEEFKKEIDKKEEAEEDAKKEEL